MKTEDVHKILEMMDEFTLAFSPIHQKENMQYQNLIYLGYFLYLIHIGSAFTIHAPDL